MRRELSRGVRTMQKLPGGISWSMSPGSSWDLVIFHSVSTVVISCQKLLPHTHILFDNLFCFICHLLIVIQQITQNDICVKHYHTCPPPPFPMRTLPLSAIRDLHIQTITLWQIAFYHPLMKIPL